VRTIRPFPEPSRSIPADLSNGRSAFPVAGDIWVEGDEDFIVVLSSDSVAISKAVGTATILSDDPYFELEDVVVVEGDSGTTDAEFIIRLIDCPADRTVSVNYTTVDGTATAGVDYAKRSGTVVFLPGEPREQTITVPVYGDTIDEPDEDFYILLSQPSGAIILDYVARAVILNDDRPTLSVDDVTVVEGDEGTVDAVFTVSLSSNPYETVTVRYATADGTATGGEDYLPVHGMLVFEPNQPLEQTVRVPVWGDTLDELDETFFLELSDPTYATFQRTVGVGTILDDDPKIWIDDVAVLEGDNGTT
jgi:hypothetical protein